MSDAELIVMPIVACLAAATIFAKSRGARRAVLAVKPLTMAAILAMFVVAGRSASHGVAWWLVGAGLVASTVGDVLLETETDRFVAGLASFLVAHVLYVAAFALRAADAPGGGRRVAVFGVLAVLVAYAAVVLRALWAGLGALRGPVAAYVGVIVAMAWAATTWFLLARTPEAALAIAGALFFFASDTLLALDKFRRPVPYAQALILGTYFVAQFLIASSAR